jgi:hypothetical protein
VVNSFQNISVLLKSQERRSFLVFEFSGCFLGLCPAASMDERFQKRSLRSFQRRRQCQCLIHFGPAPLVQLVAWKRHRGRHRSEERGHFPHWLEHGAQCRCRSFCRQQNREECCLMQPVVAASAAATVVNPRVRHRYKGERHRRPPLKSHARQ